MVTVWLQRYELGTWIMSNSSNNFAPKL
jgi:hypothetical protein